MLVVFAADCLITLADFEILSVLLDVLFQLEAICVEFGEHDCALVHADLGLGEQRLGGGEGLIAFATDVFLFFQFWGTDLSGYLFWRLLWLEILDLDVQGGQSHDFLRLA